MRSSGFQKFRMFKVEVEVELLFADFLVVLCISICSSVHIA